MKILERKKALLLRRQGLAMGEISRQLGVSKSSVSYWVGDVILTEKQKAQLNTNGHSIAAIEKRRVARLANTKTRHDYIIEQAKTEAQKLSKRTLWCIGVALYWGEGGKTQNIARIANSDPAVIITMMRFFREICNVPEDKFHGHIHTFEHCDTLKTEKYWSKISGIPRKRFFKTYKKPSAASKGKRDTLPYGTFQIYIHDTGFFFRMMGWIEFIQKQKYD